MANFGQLLLTSLGIQEQYRAQGGGKLKFKRIGMGSGKYTGNVMALTKLVTENVSVAISKGYVQNNAFTVEGFFSNESLATGFAWREIGVFVEDASGNEVLYCYANAGDSYDYIPATADERYAKNIRVAIAIGNATDVTIVESEGITYVDTLTFGKLRDEVATLHPTKVASGETIVVENSASLPLAGLTIYGKSTQDGDPSPEAPVEIVSVENPTLTVAGKNLLHVVGEPTTWNGITFTQNPDGTVSASGTATELAYRNFTATLPKGDYYVSGCPAGGDATNGYFIRVVAAAVDGGTDETVGDDIGNGLYFSLAEASNVIVRVVVRKDKTVNIVFNPMICPASIADKAFEKGTGVGLAVARTLHGIPVTSGGNYTDSDGQQWISDEIDLGRGVYVQKIGSVILDGSSDEEWGATAGQYHITLPDKRNNRVQVKNVLRCSHFDVPITIDNSQGFVTETYWQGGNRNVLFNYDNGVGGLDNFKAWLQDNPVTLLYLLNTPIETPLTAAEIDAYKALTSNNPCTTILNDSGAGMKAEVIGREFEAFFNTATADHAIESPDHPGCFYRIVGGEVEWVNPPMQEEHEYRTAERWNGEPVYARLFASKRIPTSATSATFTLPVDSASIIEAKGISGTGRVLPYITPTQTNYLIVNGKTATVELGAVPSKTISATVWVKYVKSAVATIEEE